MKSKELLVEQCRQLMVAWQSGYRVSGAKEEEVFTLAFPVGCWSCRVHWFLRKRSLSEFEALREPHQYFKKPGLKQTYLKLISRLL